METVIVTSVKDHLNNLKLWRPHEKVLSALEGTSFYHLAQLYDHPHPFKHNIPLLQAITNCYKPKDRVFEFGDHRLLFGLEDVLYMTGLTVDGLAVSGFDGGDYVQICRDYLGKSGKVGVTGGVKLQWLREEFQTVPGEVLDHPDSEALMPYVRAYVLYIIGSMILPDKTGWLVSISFLPLLSTKEDFNTYAWGAALLAHLHESLVNCLDDGSRCMAGHTYSLILFAIEHVPRLGLLMSGSDMECFLQSSPMDFPLLRSWSSLLHPFSSDNHHGKDSEQYAEILRNLSPDEIIWEPYKRLKADFLPQHLVGQQRMGLSRTILVCFDKAVHHVPDYCPKQFGLESAVRFEKPLKIRRYHRVGHEIDWRVHKKMRTYISIWDVRDQLLIADWPNTSHPDSNSEEFTDATPSSSFAVADLGEFSCFDNPTFGRSCFDNPLFGRSKS